jgi:RNA recognition motif-containing protein
LYVRNLPFKITAEELYDIFGKYGAVYQIRLGERSKDTRGTAFVGECCSGFVQEIMRSAVSMSSKFP